MPRGSVALALAAVVLGSAAGALARAPRREPVGCKLCRDTGRVPCAAHDRRSRRYRPFCSACAEPPCCKGVGWTPCPQCADDPTKQEAEHIAEVFARERKGEGFYPWGEELHLFKAACEHYRFKASATHRECHQFHAVAEKAFGLFHRIFGDDGVEALQWDEKAHFLILASRDQYLQFLDWYQQARNVDEGRIDFLRRSTSGARFITERLQTLIRAETGGEKRDDLILHRIAHGAGHLAIENYKVHGKTPPWLNEGWAGRSEVEALKRPAVYCIQYVAGGHEQRQPHEWRKTVRDAIRKKTIPTFDRLFDYQNVGEMGVVEWSMSISLVDWLVTKFPTKAVRLVDAIKDGTSSKEAWEQVFERDIVTIEKAWQRWARTQH